MTLGDNDSNTHPARGSCTPASHGSIEHQALLWDAINQYAESCGGEPHTLVYGNTRRQQLVVEIMRLVYQSNNRSSVSGPASGTE